MNKRLCRIPLALLLLAAACAPAGQEGAPPDAAALENELMEADRAFAAATAERGLEGWVSFFAEDAARVEIQGRIIRGLAGIRDYDGELLDDPTRSLAWDPTDAGVFGDGTVGFTRGRYELIDKTAQESEALLSSGSYLTIWQRGEAGWKVLLDTGVPDDTEE